MDKSDEHHGGGGHSHHGTDEAGSGSGDADHHDNPVPHLIGVSLVLGFIFMLIIDQVYCKFFVGMKTVLAILFFAKCYDINPQNKYNSTIFINPKIFVDVDGTLTFNKHG